MKKLMVRFISHEIRTPLNTIFMGLVYLDEKLKAGNLSPAELDDAISDLKLSTDQALEVLNQLLMYDKIDSGLQKLDKTIFAVMPLIKATMRQFSIQVR
jgi:signal transduction histidine kinase